MSLAAKTRKGGCWVSIRLLIPVAVLLVKLSAQSIIHLLFFFVRMFVCLFLSVVLFCRLYDAENLRRRLVGVCSKATFARDRTRTVPNRIVFCLHGTVLKPVRNGSNGSQIGTVKSRSRFGSVPDRSAPERSRVNRRPLRSDFRTRSI